MGMAHDTGDCSDRICPFELAWVDTPLQSGLRHRYAECAGRGICNRDTAECECFEGYEGKGCQRTVCPNDCSGHGTCEYLEDLTYAAVEFDYRHKEFLQESQGFTYYGWDSHKTRGCVCDPEYADVDCSKRMCPYGTDVMDAREDLTRDTRYQTQRISFVHNSGVSTLDGSTYALTFKSKLNETFTTIPLVFDSTDILSMANEMEAALHNLPNGVIDGVHVHTGLTTNELVANVTFTGDSNQGIAVTAMTGNVTMIQDADYNSFECGRRGKCDYDTGICQCFEGFTGPSCGTCTSLI
ncbi:Ocm2 [Symbiodinium microadriaticum]|nr:Ocm2 [Symbiodinium microadriaticum]